MRRPRPVGRDDLVPNRAIQMLLGLNKKNRHRAQRPHGLRNVRQQMHLYVTIVVVNIVGAKKRQKDADEAVNLVQSRRRPRGRQSQRHDVGRRLQQLSHRHHTHKKKKRKGKNQKQQNIIFKIKTKKEKRKGRKKEKISKRRERSTRRKKRKSDGRKIKKTEKIAKKTR
jgi:hypothetical protein